MSPDSLEARRDRLERELDDVYRALREPNPRNPVEEEDELRAEIETLQAEKAAHEQRMAAMEQHVAALNGHIGGLHAAYGAQIHNLYVQLSARERREVGG